MASFWDHNSKVLSSEIEKIVFFNSSLIEKIYQTSKSCHIPL